MMSDNEFAQALESLAAERAHEQFIFGNETRAPPAPVERGRPMINLSGALDATAFENVANPPNIFSAVEQDARPHALVVETTHGRDGSASMQLPELGSPLLSGSRGSPSVVVSPIVPRAVPRTEVELPLEAVAPAASPL